MRILFAALGVLLVVGAGVFAYQKLSREETQPAPVVEMREPSVEVIGRSVDNRNIEAYRFPAREGAKHVVFVGGIHGGYEWNSTLLAYELIDYLKANPSVHASVDVTVIPNANPDGMYAVVGKEARFAMSDVPKATQVSGFGRFNANDVDLNRNFDCKWKPTSMWRGQNVSAGTASFSEPEARAIRDFMLRERPSAAVFFHSQANAVYASECEQGILPETTVIMNMYAQATGYAAIDVFDAYEITGDAEGWLASQNIPAITVELSTHDTVEWDKNLLGIRALLRYFSVTP